MDRIIFFRRVIEKLLTEYASVKPANLPAIEHELIFDHNRDRYILLSTGFDASRRVHFPVFHIDIIDGKVWVQADNTDYIMAERLVDAGIDRQEIVLGFHPPKRRPHTDYAAA